MFSNKILPEFCSYRFSCQNCNYNTSKKSSFDDHLLSRKHTESMIDNEILPKICSDYSCPNCDKTYKDYSGLWRHKKKCGPSKEGGSTIVDKDLTDKDLIMTLIKENSELKNLVFKVLENGTHNSTINNNTNNETHTNSHNKAFNLQFFLNETCKNAMNITDFVDSIKLQLSDLMDIGEAGYVESISKIIVKNLNNLDETERPIHCTDKKRETFYVKDQGQWQKEDEEKKRLKKVVKSIANKYFKMLPQYREKYPDYRDSDSIHSDEHSKIVIEVMTTDSAKDDKIVRNVSKATVIKGAGSA
jgi:hypothetical protein